MPPVSWLEIRNWNGSQSDAFEELCCQLAHSEVMPEASKFTAKGRPDSGLECYWTLPTGEEWGWQAKFFHGGLTKSRWQQCDDSVRKALTGHPKLAKLFFCFPYKFPDSRKPNELTAAKQWEDHCEKWAEWAEKDGKSIEIICWDEHELVLRLSKPENHGRYWFWFNAPVMDADWYKRNLAAAVLLAGERYTPDLHFALPLAQYFDALGRTPVFTAILAGLGRKLDKAIADVANHLRPSNLLLEASKATQNSLDEALANMNSLAVDAGLQINFHKLEKSLSLAQEQVENALHQVWEKRRQNDGHSQGNQDFSDYSLHEACSCIGEVLEFCHSSSAILANNPAMLLVGEAGLGKTHLVCSVAENRIASGLPTILLLGQQFDNSEPWSQILKITGVSCDRDTFLGALNASGEASGYRTLIIIDAINEGAGMRFWQGHLAGIVSHIRNYPHVGIAITIRKEYLNTAEMPKQQLVFIEHHGFAGVANKATRHFFQHYGLAEPNVPMLDPEFESPLFLKLVCLALRDSLKSELPTDLVGVSSIFKFVIDETNKRIAGKLDYPPTTNLVRQAVHRIAGLMAESGNEAIPFDVANRELKMIHPAEGYSRSLLHQLIVEHILVQLPGPRDRDEELICFTYQRLSHHLIIQSTLARTPKRNLRKLFKPGGLFGREVGEDSFFLFAGWIEALAVQLPETYDLEIDQLLLDTWDNQVLRHAFLNSIIWRNPKTFSGATDKRIRELAESSYRMELLESIVCVTARPKHPYNANWLDAVLRPMRMANRDAFWSVYLFGKIEQEGNIHRLIEWAWAERVENRFTDEVVRLAALTLTWCLTTSDRFVRDRATKALVGLLEHRISILRWLLEHFSSVAEPYIQERLHAAAYGCAMLTGQTQELRKLAQDVYDRIFRNGSPPASVLLRDHARGIIERALYLELHIDFDPTLIIPPYRSTWPKAPPSLSKLEKIFKCGTYGDETCGLRRIFESVTSDDFSRYIIGDVEMWSDRRRKGKASQSPKSLFEELLTALPPDTVDALRDYAKCLQRIHAPNHYYGETLGGDQASRRYVDQVDTNLNFYLSKSQIRLFRNKIMPYLKDPDNKRHSRVFNKKLFERIILNRVVELGWTCELFNDFDRNVSDKGRSPHKAERIGKKYQWIAYDEFHARISDNFGLAEKGVPIMRDGELERGTWPETFRDLDPSLLLQKLPHDTSSENQQNWWTPHKYNAWTSAPTPLDWLQQTEDLPPPTDFLELTGPDKQKWLALDAYASWRRVDSVGNLQGRKLDRQEAHYIFRSYIVRLEHLSNVMNWGQRQDWINDRLPSACG